MRTKYHSTLRDKTCRIKGYNICDRSCAEARQEVLVGLPPIAWMTSVFGGGFAFNCMCGDSQEGAGEWADIYAGISYDAALKGG